MWSPTPPSLSLWVPSFEVILLQISISLRIIQKLWSSRKSRFWIRPFWSDIVMLVGFLKVSLFLFFLLCLDRLRLLLVGRTDHHDEYIYANFLFSIAFSAVCNMYISSPLIAFWLLVSFLCKYPWDQSSKALQWLWSEFWVRLLGYMIDLCLYLLLCDCSIVCLVTCWCKWGYFWVCWLTFVFLSA